MYLLYPTRLEKREFGSKIVGAMVQGERPQILLTPNEILDMPLDDSYLINLRAASGREDFLWEYYAPAGKLLREYANRMEWE